MAKSYRSVNIRVSAVNDTQKGVIQYSKKSIENILKRWSENKSLSYWLIEHNSEVNQNVEQNKHFHIVIKFQSPTPFADIKKKFPYGDIESSKRIHASIQYLIHKNHPTKKQYRLEDIKTNDNKGLLEYMKQSNDLNSLERVLQDINLGKIREWNQWQLIPYDIYSKFKSRIENAHIHYKEKIYMDKDRKIQTVFISGDTGVGKTTFAKMIARKLGKSYCVSSASNDPFQDYFGQDILILDDLRDVDISYTDLLKALDKHTKSTVKSRYHNKCFLGDMIIITSCVPLEDWYFNHKSEEKRQLKRRIMEMYIMSLEDIRHFRYNEVLNRYELIDTAKNHVLELMQEQYKETSFFKQMGWVSKEEE